MINLTSEPSLGSMVLTRDGVWKYTYVLPNGMTFPAGAASQVNVTDRSGAVLGTFTGAVGTAEVDYLVDQSSTVNIPAGSNWELTVTFDDGTGSHTYVVRYGRVVRSEPPYPLNPVNDSLYTAVMYEDTLNRSAVGPRWVPISGQVAMLPITPGPPSYALAVQSVDFFLPLTLYSTAAILWYAPVNGDSVSVTFQLLPQVLGAGQTTIVLCSNYQMTSYLGIQFDNTVTPNTVGFIQGTGPTTAVQLGSKYDYTTTQNDVLTVAYSLPSNTASLYLNSSTSPVMQYTDTDNLIIHGPGYRYLGANWIGSLGPPPPLLWYWKAMDTTT